MTEFADSSRSGKKTSSAKYRPLSEYVSMRRRGIDVPGPETVALQFCDPLDPLADYIDGTLFIGFQPFRRGDVSGNGVIDLPDAVFGLNYLFAQGPPPGCLDTLDWDEL